MFTNTARLVYRTSSYTCKVVDSNVTYYNKDGNIYIKIGDKQYPESDYAKLVESIPDLDGTKLVALIPSSGITFITTFYIDENGNVEKNTGFDVDYETKGHEDGATGTGRRRMTIEDNGTTRYSGQTIATWCQNQKLYSIKITMGSILVHNETTDSGMSNCGKMVTSMGTYTYSQIPIKYYKWLYGSWKFYYNGGDIKNPSTNIFKDVLSHKDQYLSGTTDSISIYDSTGNKMIAVARYSGTTVKNN